jgi:hypothetical protein
MRIGVLGAGHLGKIHLKLWQERADVEIAGFFDSSPEVSERVARQMGLRAYADAQALISDCDALDIVTPTSFHFGYACQALEAGKHLFVEKPLVSTLEEAQALRALAARNPRLKIQVGHVERFNPAYLAVGQQIVEPMFIEGHRLALFNPRGTDVSVVLDLMIHDLDIVLDRVGSPLRQVSASGVAVVSATPDIANARIEFENGCVANLTASRISVKNMRRLRFFRRQAYIAVDFLAREAEVLRLLEGEAAQGAAGIEIEAGRLLAAEKPQIPEGNAIAAELDSFLRAIREDRPPAVGLEAGCRALEVAWEIIAQIERGQQRYGA